MWNGKADQPDGLTPVSRSRRAAIIFVAAIAFTAKLLLALKTYGTNDVYSYERFAVWSRYFGADLYRIAPDLNHPPSMLHALSFLHWVSERTQLPFQFCIRFPGILADAASLWLICRILGSRIAERSVFIAVLLIAIAPIHILISGFHGNTDPVMIFFVIAAVWLAGYRGNSPAGGVAWGLAICVKVVPLILAPVFFLSLPGWKKRLAFFSASVVVVAVAWSPFLFQQPSLVMHQVFGYQSSYGLWGFSWLVRQIADTWPAAQWLNTGFRRAGTPLLMAAIVILSVRMNRLPGGKPSLYTQVGMVFLLFFAGTSGFAVQYLAWLTPWVAELGALPVALFMLTGSVFLLVVYNYWTLGTPWYLAIAYPWQHHQYFQAICWMSVLLLTFLAWRRVLYGENSPISLRFHPRISPRLRFSAAMLAIAVFLVYPAAVHMRRDKLGPSPAYAEDEVLYTEATDYHDLAGELYRRGRTSEAIAVESQAVSLDTRAQRATYALLRSQPARSDTRTPESYMDASLDDYNHGAFGECVADATESLKFRPGMPSAWYNISLCQSELGNWDAAIISAKEALRYDPDYDVAQQNLDSVVSQKLRATAFAR